MTQILFNTNSSKKALFLPFLPATLLALGTASGHAQGSLTPSGGPAPSMKTLQQIEPRTPISSLPYTITNSGSYYLTGNLTGLPGTNGITVLANHVTLDLNGFTLSGVPGSADGINVGNAPFLGAISTTNLAVFNGIIQGWGSHGIRANNLRNGRFEQLLLSTNGVHGLDAGSGSVVSRCVAASNGSYGFDTDGPGTLFETCSARNNASDGFHVGAGRVVNCIASQNGFNGFLAFNDTVVSSSTAMDNVRSGIALVSGAVALNNSCLGNNTANVVTAGGISAALGSSRIEGNHITYNNGFGIVVADGVTRVVVTRNTTVGVPANSHSIAAGNDVGPWGQAATATSPWANIRN